MTDGDTPPGVNRFRGNVGITQGEPTHSAATGYRSSGWSIAASFSLLAQEWGSICLGLIPNRRLDGTPPSQPAITPLQSPGRIIVAVLAPVKQGRQGRTSKEATPLWSGPGVPLRRAGHYWPWQCQLARKPNPGIGAIDSRPKLLGLSEVHFGLKSLIISPGSESAPGPVSVGAAGGCTWWPEERFSQPAQTRESFPSPSRSQAGEEGSRPARNSGEVWSEPLVDL